MVVDKLVGIIAPYTDSALLPDGDEQAVKARALAKEKQEEVVQAITGFINNAQSSTVGITGMIVLSYLAGGLGILGLVFMAIGFFAPHLVHLF